MDEREQTGMQTEDEMPEERWHKVYVAVLLTTIAVICALWFFSRYFSN